MEPRVSEHGIKQSYEGQSYAEEYVGKRFEGGVFRLLHTKQVETVQRMLAECDVGIVNSNGGLMSKGKYRIVARLRLD